MPLLAWWLWLAPPTEPNSQGVSWQAPESCISEIRFQERVAAVRGGAELSGPLAFEVSREPTSGLLELSISGQAERYASGDCESLVETALLIVSLSLVEPEPVSEAPRAPATGLLPSLGPDDAAAEAAEIEPQLRRRDRGTPAPRWEPRRFRVLGEAGLTGFITRQPAADLYLGAGPRGRAWSVDLGLRARPSFPGESGQPGAAARLSTWSGQVRGCGGTRTRRLSLFACGSVELGVASATPVGDVVDTQVGRQAWSSAQLGPELGVRLSDRFALVMRAAPVLMLIQPRFEIGGAGKVCCEGALGLAGHAGIEVGVGR